MANGRRKRLPGVAERARVITAIVIEPIAPPVQAWIPALGATRSSEESAVRRKPAGTNA